jgi:hypothetical protein
VVTATETIEQVLAPDTGPRTVVYEARGRNHRLVRRPRQVIPNQFGQQVIAQEGVAYDFAPNGRLTLEEGQDPLDTGPRGETEDAISWIRRHAHLNVYFWEQGREPDRPLPTDEQMLERIMRAGMDLQPHRLLALIATEESTHHRQMLLNVARATLGQVLRTLQITSAEDLPDETDEERIARETQEHVERTDLEAELARQRAGGVSEHEIAKTAAAAEAARMAATLQPADDAVR